MLESMPLPERLRSMAAQVARNDLSGATTRRLIELDMLEAANLLATLPASMPPGDACVRHACKRVRMEMQAEIERLRGLLRRCYTERMTDELDEAIGDAIKGDSHAG